MDVKPRDPFHDERGKSLVGPGNLGKGAGLAHWLSGNDPTTAAMGHNKGWRLAAEAMGIPWMKRSELTQAIPPAYTEFMGKQLLCALSQVGQRQQC